MLTPDQASACIGVPAHQLLIWAWDRVGPRNSGSRYRPMYLEEDLIEWRDQRVRYMLTNDEIEALCPDAQHVN